MYSDIPFIGRANRGQVSAGSTGLAISFAVVTVGGVVILVVLDAVNEFSEGVNESAFAEAQNNTVVCNGVGPGCGGTFEWIPVAFVIAVLVGLILFIRGVMLSGSEPTDRNQDGGKSEVEILKDAYVEGDIQTTVKLENDLDELLDADIDDRDVQELDDLLNDDNGDENDEQ